MHLKTHTDSFKIIYFTFSQENETEENTGKDSYDKNRNQPVERRQTVGEEE